MCPPVVGIPNLPKTGREPHGVSDGRTHGPAPGRRFPPYFTILMPSMVQGGYDTATLKGRSLHPIGILPSPGSVRGCITAP